MKYLRIVFLLLIITSINTFSFKLLAQRSALSAPPSLEQLFDYDLIETKYLHGKGNEVLELAKQNDGQPMWAGLSVITNITPANSGTIFGWPNGQTSWLIRLKSPGALALGLVLEQVSLVEGSTLFLYSEENPREFISISASDIYSEHTSTPIIKGETLIVEYTERTPAGLKFPAGNFVITDFVLIYNGLSYAIETKDLGDSQYCQVNINCSPEGDNWQIVKRGIARILFREGTSWFWCSGTLINNTNNDGTPFFLTAEHCGSNASEADRNVWQFNFNYERPSCENYGTPPDYIITGCQLKAKGEIDGGSDFQLLKLSTRPPLEWNLYYNGWNRSTSTTTGGVSIHHPRGDAKKISTFTASLISSTPNIGGSQMATNSAWKLNWAATDNGHGVTEGGSSGSPLFNSGGQVVGTLSGGGSSCSTPNLNDFYGKFNYHWSSNGSSDSERLQPWLDPINSDVLAIDGYDPAEDFTHVFSESFENPTFPPDGWQRQSSSSNTWQVSSGYSFGTQPTILINPQQGTRFAYVPWHQTATQNEWLISPAIDISELSKPVLRFWFNGSYYWSIENNNCDLRVMARKNESSSWEQIWGENDHDGFTNETSYRWILTDLSLQQFQGEAELQIAFVYIGTDGASFNVDNIKIGEVKHSLTVVTQGQGIVTVNGNLYEDRITVDHGTELTLQAFPDDQWRFLGWDIGLLGSQNPINITMNSNKLVFANFAFGSYITDNQLHEITVYPNPFSSKLFFNNTQIISRIVVTNVLGQVLVDKAISEAEENSISVNNLSNGLYFITIYSFTGDYVTRKIIKE